MNKNEEILKCYNLILAQETNFDLLEKKGQFN